MPAKPEQEHLFVKGDICIPIKVYREFRTNARASLGKKGAILRLPKLLPPFQQKAKLQWLKNWLEERLAADPNIALRFKIKRYKHGDTIQVGSRNYTLHIIQSDRKSASAKLVAGVITVKLPQNLSTTEERDLLPKLLSRVVAKDFLPEIQERVQTLNKLYFNRKIGTVRLKYTHSRWGSCSNAGNINLSSRLLFAPQQVIDYVIIHELAHLIEFNHSPRFWSIIAQIMPDYQQQEKWLKENSARCVF